MIGRVALPTGAASGIGRARAVKLAAGGAATALVDRDTKGLRPPVAAVDGDRLIRGVLTGLIAPAAVDDLGASRSVLRAHRACERGRA